MNRKGAIEISETIIIAFGIVVSFFIMASLGSMIFSDQAETSNTAVLGIVAKDIAAIIDTVATESGSVGMIYEMPKGLSANVEIDYKKVTVTSGEESYTEPFIALTHTARYNIENPKTLCIVKNQDDMKIAVSKDRCACNRGDGRCDPGCLLGNLCDTDCHRNLISDHICDKRCLNNNDGICDPDCDIGSDTDCFLIPDGSN